MRAVKIRLLLTNDIEGRRSTSYFKRIGRKSIIGKRIVLPLILFLLLSTISSYYNNDVNKGDCWIRYKYHSSDIAKPRSDDIDLFQYLVFGNFVGLCSTINNALNAMLLAQLVGRGFRLEIDGSTWAYKSLDEFLDSPIIKEGKGLKDKCHANKSAILPVSFEEFKRSDNNHRDLVLCHEDSANWEPFRNLSRSLENTLGIETAFHTKRRLVQEQFWHLKEPYENFIDLIVKRHPLLQDPERPFLAMHVRAGDKIMSSEMVGLFQRDYYAALGQFQDILGKSMKATLFIFSDDDVMANRVRYYVRHYANLSFTAVASGPGEKAFYRQKTKQRYEIPSWLPHVDIQVLFMADLYQFVHDQSLPDCYKPDKQDLIKIPLSRGHFQREFGFKNEALRLKTTRDIVSLEENVQYNYN